MTSRDFEALFAQAHVSAPDALAHLLSHPEEIPPWFRADIHTDPSQLVELNAELRRDGFSSEPWPNEFIALGRDPGGNIYFTDTRDASFPVYLADHELVHDGCLLSLGCAELWGSSIDAFLQTLAARDREMEEDTPFAVFNAGLAEVETLRRRPDTDSLEQLFWSRARPYCALTPTRRRKVRGSLFGGLPGWGDLKGHPAFTLIEPAVEIAVRQETQCLFGVALALLAQITQAADTSEMPAVLEKEWEKLRGLARSHESEQSESWAELERQYRRT